MIVAESLSCACGVISSETARFVLFVKFFALRGIDVSRQSVTVSVISFRVICVSFWRFVVSVRNAARFSVSPIGDAVKLPWRLCFTALMLKLEWALEWSYAEVAGALKLLVFGVLALRLIGTLDV